MSDIITLQNLKDYLGLDAGDTREDVKLQIIVDATNAAIDNYVYRKLGRTTYSNVYLDGTGTDALCLPNYPVVSIESITINDEELVMCEPPFDSDDSSPYGYYFPEAPVDGVLYHSTCWPPGRHVILITEYQAGYGGVDDEGEPLEDAIPVPADLYLGALDMASYYRTVTKKTGLASESSGGYAASLLNTLNATNGELTIPSIPFQMALNKYRVNLPFLV